MSLRTAELHADWLGLVEPEGQFLSLPVLRRAFPDGLDVVPTVVREQVRERYPHGQSPSQGQWDDWIDWLLREALSWGPYYRTGDDAFAYVHALPEYGVTLRADAALCDTKSGEPRVLIMRHPHGTALDRRLAGERWNASPVDRLLLLCRAQNVRLGMVTDGERIVLAWVPASGVGGYATWDTALFTESRERNLLQSFLSLLHASRFFAVQKDAQLEALFEASEKAQNEVTGQLGLQVRQAVELLVTALSRADLDRGGTLLVGVAPKTVYEAAATVMMRLVFLLYAEERDLLPLADPLYADCYAASTLREQLDAQAAMEGDEPLERRSAAWFRLLALFRVLYAGLNHDRLRLPPYGGRLFDPDRFAFLEGRTAGELWPVVHSRPLPVDDLTVRAILEAIQTLPIRESGSKDRRRLSFRALDVEQIGHVYEGLLDHGAERVDEIYVGLVGKSGEEAEIPLRDLENAVVEGPKSLVALLQKQTGRSESAIEDMINRGRDVVAGKDPEARRLVNTVCDNNASLASRILPFTYTLRTDLHGLPVVFPTQSFVVKPTRARRDSGTEYTPRRLAEEMVRYALDPLVYSPGPKDGVEREEWQLRSSADLLALKVCDLAVGSGAFLVSACRYLADRVAEAWLTEEPARSLGSTDDLTLEARRAVVDRCLYGVDRDSMAIEMAKLSLWLITMARDRPFSFLDHSIRCGDSLLGVTSLDQLLAAHTDPQQGRQINDGFLFSATSAIKPLLEEAANLRLQLEEMPDLDIRTSQEKQRLHDESNRLLQVANVVADGIIGTTLTTLSLSESKRNGAFQNLSRLVLRLFDTSSTEGLRGAALDALLLESAAQLNAGRPAEAEPRACLHWPLAFPEVFTRAAPGFDVVLGNPPFLGGDKIRLTLGGDYRSLLVALIAKGRRGKADLSAYFFLRAAQVSRSLALIGTNSIAERDTREVGLDALVASGWRIVRANKDRGWPGRAGVFISQLWLENAPSLAEPVLNGTLTKTITANLEPAGRVIGNPHKLLANAQVVFEGSSPLGKGFWLTIQEGNALIDAAPGETEVVLPFINAEDVCDSPTLSPGRFVINFWDWSLERAEKYSAFAILEARAKPERAANRSPVIRNAPWWLHIRARIALYKKLSTLRSVFVVPSVSKYLMPMKLPSTYIYSKRLAVFASESATLFGIVTSDVHHVWARSKGGRHVDRPSYTPSDCFETFPLPGNLDVDDDEVIKIIDDLDLCRRELMKRNQEGLTLTYNRFNADAERDPEVLRLRELHAELDRAVCKFYGWSDLKLDHGLREVADGLRYTMSDDARKELLDRLLQLNHERYAAESREPASNIGMRRKLKRVKRSNGSLEDSAISLLVVAGFGDDDSVEN